MHHIQKTILDQLMSAQIKRFSELRPSYVESNLFQYHLRHVIKEGYVEKVPGGYVLSPRGLYYADRHSSSLRTVREQPKIITVIVIRDRQGRVLLQQKLRQPFVGTYHLPAGKIHENESIHQAAQRELQEKSSLVDVELSHVSTVHARISTDDQLISEYIGFVYTGTIDTSLEDAIWYDLSQPSNHVLAPSVAEILQTFDLPQAGLHEIDVQL